jgi:endonuclease-3
MENDIEIAEILKAKGKKLLESSVKPLQFVDHPEANALVNDLDNCPHAFVLACLMDRQIKAELAWMIPYEFSERVGIFAIEDIAKLTKEDVVHTFLLPTPLHRFPEKMGEIFYLGIQKIKKEYGGVASRIWNDNPKSATLIRRFLSFKGAGPKIATMAANILVRDFKIPVKDKIDLDISADVLVVRVFIRLGLVREGASNEEVIYRARELNRAYPGVFDLATWEIGRQWCRPREPSCVKCYLEGLCPSSNLAKDEVAGHQETYPIREGLKVIAFIDDDYGYLRWVRTNRRGYVLNCLRTPSSGVLMLHKATCWTITGETSRRRRWTDQYIKVCSFDKNELSQWAWKEVGKEVRNCKICGP